MLDRNRLGTTTNPYQGGFKRVLCVCSAGLLRSPTIAWVLSNDPYNYNTRAVGCNKEYGFIQLDGYQLAWAQEIVCAETSHAEIVNSLIEKHKKDLLQGAPVVKALDIPDIYEYRDSRLTNIIRVKYDAWGKE